MSSEISENNFDPPAPKKRKLPENAGKSLDLTQANKLSIHDSLPDCACIRNVTRFVCYSVFFASVASPSLSVAWNSFRENYLTCAEEEDSRVTKCILHYFNK